MLDFVVEVLEKYGLSDRFDAKKVLLKMGGRRPGKRCKKGWIAAEKQCSDHKTAEGKLTAAGKSSASELADKVRMRKGLSDRNAPKVVEGMKDTKAKAKEFEGFKKHYLAQAKDVANNTERNGDAYATSKPIDGVKFYFVKGDKHDVLAVKDGEGAVLGRYDVQIFEGEARRLGKAFSIADYRMNKDADRAALDAGIMDQDLPDAVRNHFPEAVKTYDFYKARRKDSSDRSTQHTSRVRRLNR